jgi:hypothetical protein
MEGGHLAALRLHPLHPYHRMKQPQLRPHGDSLSARSDLHSYGSISEHVRPPSETVTDLATVDAIIPLVVNSAIICHLP